MSQTAPPAAWYNFRNGTKPKTAEISIYDEIGGWGTNAREFVGDLNRLQVDEITLRIHSPGGSIFAGNAIFNALQRHKAKVHVVIDGLAASMASVIAMAGDTIEIAENGVMMIHNPLTYTAGESKDLRQAADVLDKLKDGLVTAYQNRTGLDRQEISDLMDAETWMTAQEAMDKGFVDFIGGKVDAKNSFDLSRFNAGGVDGGPAGMRLKDLMARLAGKKPAEAAATAETPAATETTETTETPATEETATTEGASTEATEETPSTERDAADAENPGDSQDPAARASAPDLTAALDGLRSELADVRGQIATLTGERDAANRRADAAEAEIRDATAEATRMIALMPIEQPLPRGNASGETPSNAAKTADEIRAEYKAIEDKDARFAFYQKHKDVLCA